MGPVSSTIASQLFNVIIANRKIAKYFRFIKKIASQKHLQIAKESQILAIAQTLPQIVHSIATMAAFLAVIVRNRRNRREFQARLTMDRVRDMDFVSRYRLDRTGAERLLQLVGQDLFNSSRGGQTISPETQVCRNTKHNLELYECRKGKYL